MKKSEKWAVLGPVGNTEKKNGPMSVFFFHVFKAIKLHKMKLRKM